MQGSQADTPKEEDEAEAEAETKARAFEFGFGFEFGLLGAVAVVERYSSFRRRSSLREDLSSSTRTLWEDDMCLARSGVSEVGEAKAQQSLLRN